MQISTKCTGTQMVGCVVREVKVEVKRSERPVTLTMNRLLFLGGKEKFRDVSRMHGDANPFIFRLPVDGF